jgi:hypothetical protein
MEAGSESERSEPEFVDPFDSVSDRDPDDGASAATREGTPAPEVELPPLMRASDLLPQGEPVEDDGAEAPPTPEEAVLLDMTLAERETHKMAQMTPERRAAYDKATSEIMSHPAVAAFAAEEDRIRASKEATSKAFIEAYRKRQKEKS